jgi:D-alanyl-D-alanine dipeptidase
MKQRWGVRAAGALMALLLVFAATRATRAEPAPGAAEDWRALVASGQLVEVDKAAPGVRIDLRYAGPHNCVGAPIYPPELPCLLRPVIAKRLEHAQQLLQTRGCGLKIWDGYRPVAAQHAIWSHFARLGFVANPDDGRGSLHSWGLAVDVTMVDAAGHDVAMPSDFDVFAPVASGIYRGSNPQVAANLRLLQAVMKASGFIGLSTEWWHFAARDWQQFGRLQEAPAAGQSPAGVNRMVPNATANQ